MKKIPRSDLHRTLQSLGFNRYESVVYPVLLELGPCNAGSIIKQTSLHRVFVYNALETLEAKGLASYVVQRNRKVFQASHPSSLLKHERQKLQSLEALVPQLIKLQQDEKERLEVRVRYGKDEFFRNMLEHIDDAAGTDKIMRIIGGGSWEAWSKALDEYELPYRQASKTAGIRKRMITPGIIIEKYARRFLSERANSLRIVKEGLSSPTYTRITRTLTSIEIYAADIVIIQIRNEAVSQGFLEHFDLLWKKAKPYDSKNSS